MNGRPYFAPDSMLPIVHRERIVGLSGIRALMMQAADPITLYAFLAQTTFFSDPYKRLERTDRAMMTMYLGDRRRAERVGARVAQMHARIDGEVTEPYGPLPVGTRFTGTDSHLLAWTHMTVADSALVYFERFVRPLRPEQREEYWQQYREVGRLLGIDGDAMPADVAELRDRVARHGRDTAWISREYREQALEILFAPPAPAHLRPVIEAVRQLTVMMLPDEYRAVYRLHAVPASGLLRILLGQWTRHLGLPVLAMLPGGPSLRYVPAMHREVR